MLQALLQFLERYTGIQVGAYMTLGLGFWNSILEPLLQAGLVILAFCIACLTAAIKFMEFQKARREKAVQELQAEQ